MAFSKFNSFVDKLGKGVYNLNADTLKVALTDSAPSSANTVLADITQIAAANGYSSGGATVPSSAYSSSAGTGTLSGNAVVFTASGSAIAQFRYAVLYDSTVSGGPLIGWWDYGAEVNITAPNTFTINENSQATGGTILTVS